MTTKKHNPAPAALCAAFLFASLLSGASADTYADSFPTVLESQWIGQRFIILPQSRAVQHYGYQEMYQDQNTLFAPLPYRGYAGKIVRVSDIEHASGVNGEKLDEAELQLEGTGQTIHADVDKGCMEDAAPASDLETAKKLYLGRTLWLASDHLTTYDPNKDISDSPAAVREAFQKIHLKQYSPVKVVDVVPGWYASVPVRFVVEDAAGRQGYVDVHMSDTNVPDDLKASGRFTDTFFLTDPRAAHAWPATIWTAIENRQVTVGMTFQQVRLSWGMPVEVRKPAGQNGTEQWVYGEAHILTLTDGVVKAIAR